MFLERDVWADTEPPSATNVTDQVWKRSTERFYSITKFYVSNMTAVNQNMIKQDVKKQQKYHLGERRRRGD